MNKEKIPHPLDINKEFINTHSIEELQAIQEFYKERSVHFNKAIRLRKRRYDYELLTEIKKSKKDA